MTSIHPINNVLVIGISGVTCGGKTTLAEKLCQILPNCQLISQDSYYLNVEDSRHVWLPHLNHINFDILSSLDMEKMHHDILAFLKSNETSNVTTTNGVGRELSVKQLLHVTNMKVLIVEGFCVFNYAPMRNAFHLKYYFVLDKEECWKRRQMRIYEPPDCPGYFELCAWPEHLNQLKEVRDEVEDVKYIDGNSKNTLEIVLKDVAQLLQQLR